MHQRQMNVDGCTAPCGHSLTTPEARIARIDEEGLDLKPSKAKTAKNKEAGWPLASWIYGLLVPGLNTNFNSACVKST